MGYVRSMFRIAALSILLLSAPTPAMQRETQGETSPEVTWLEDVAAAESAAAKANKPLLLVFR